MVEGGNPEAAVRLLHGALKELKEVIASAEKMAASVKQSSRACYFDHSEAMNSSAFLSKPVAVGGDGWQRPSPDGTFAFCDQLLVPSPATLCSRATPEIFTMIAAASMYNLGWIRHRAGLWSGRSSDLLASKRMYELAAATLGSLPSHSEEWIDEAVLQLRCCLYNNLGHAYEQLGETETGRCILVSLIDLLEESADYVDDTMSDDDFDFYAQYLGMDPNRSFCTAQTA